MNRLRDRVGLNVPPLFLRLALGVIFLWAGLGKISVSSPVQGDDAAILANMGVVAPPGNTAVVRPPAAPAAAPAATGATGQPDEAPAGEPKPPGEPKPSGARTGEGPGRMVLVQGAARTYTAADFPQPVHVLMVHQLTLMLYKGTHPAPRADGGPGMLMWPRVLGEGSWPRYQAWAVALTELVGGAALLLGLFTRVMALAVGVVMMGALWLTQSGPAIQAEKAVLWILPAYDRFSMEWQSLFLQFALLMSALALAFLGPGRLSLDRAILGGPERKEDDEDDE